LDNKSNGLAVDNVDNGGIIIAIDSNGIKVTNRGLSWWPISGRIQRTRTRKVI